MESDVRKRTRKKGWNRASEKADTWSSIRLCLLAFLLLSGWSGGWNGLGHLLQGCDGTLKCSVIPHSASCIVET